MATPQIQKQFPTRVRLYNTWANDVEAGDPLFPLRGDLLSVRADNQIFYRTWDWQHQNADGTVVGSYGQVEDALNRQLDAGGVPVVTFRARVPFVGTADAARAYFTVPVTTTRDYELLLLDNRLVALEPDKRVAFHAWRKLNTVGEPVEWIWRPAVAR